MADATIGLRIKLVKDTATPLVNQLLKNVANQRPALEEIGSNLRASTRERFRDSHGPVEGLGAGIVGPPKPWKKLKPATIARRRAGKFGAKSSKPLVDRGNLERSIIFAVTDSALYVGTNHEIAPGISPAIHQLGGKSYMAPGARAIPARPFLGIDQRDQQMIERVAARHLLSGIGASL